MRPPEDFYLVVRRVTNGYVVANDIIPHRESIASTAGEAAAIATALILANQLALNEMEAPPL